MREEFFRVAVGNSSGSHPWKAGVVLLVVLPREELLAETAGLGEGAEAIRKAGAVLQRFEVGFRVGVVVGDRRAAVPLEDTESS